MKSSFYIYNAIRGLFTATLNGKKITQSAIEEAIDDIMEAANKVAADLAREHATDE